MNKITLAIPFYNTSEYFIEAVQYALTNDFVKEILVSDDCSESSHYEKLQDIITELGSEKIRLIKTDKNIKAFKNKYFIVSKCKTDWIYLLDSDNHMTENTLDLIKSIKKPDPKTIYCPEKLILHNYHESPYGDVTYDFGSRVIDVDVAKTNISNNVKWFDWFLNTGNYVFNKQAYLDCIEEPILEDIDPFAADVVTTSYFWLKAGGKFEIVENFEYYHRIRSEGYWNSCGSDSTSPSQTYTSKILSI